jgi:hypothetical protein
MALFIANFDPNTGEQFEAMTAFMSLAKLVNGDGALGMHTDLIDPSVQVVEYVIPETSGFCQTMIADLVNKNLPNKVIIHGLNSSDLVDMGGGHLVQITDISGIVMFSPAETADLMEHLPYKTHDLHVLYDVGECNGAGIVVFDSGHNIIAEPLEIVLVHELSHASHYCHRDLDFLKPEVQAEKDENFARAQHGLTLRDVDNHDGRCRRANEGHVPTFWDGLCLIVSAAYGSPEAPEVRLLQHFRDSVLRSSQIGCSFLDLFFADYYRFSPEISAAMKANPKVAGMMRAVIVQPLLDFWSWSRAYLIQQISVETLETSANDSIRLRATERVPDRTDDAVWKEIGLHSGIRKAWASGKARGRLLEPSAGFSVGNPEPLELLEDVAAFVASRVEDFDILEWTILQPVECYWRFAAAHELGAAPGWGNELAQEIQAWVATLPLRIECLPLDRNMLQIDLHTWSRDILKNSDARFKLAQALFKRPEFQVNDLESIFTGADFLPTRSKRKEGGSDS